MGLLLIIGLLAGCGATEPPVAEDVAPVDVYTPPPVVRPVESAALAFRDIGAWAALTEPGLPSGWTFIDLDDDGFDDLFRPAEESSFLLRNRGDGSFEPVGSVQHGELAQFAYAVDLTGDAREDLLVITSGGARLYENNGDTSLTPRPDRLNLDSGGDLWTVATFGDYFNKGHLDIFVAGLATHESLERAGGGEFQGDPAPDRLFRGDDLTDITGSAGIDTLVHTLSAFSTDIDGDGNVDLIVGTEGNAPDRYYLSDGKGRFTESSASLGIDAAVDLTLASTSAMGFDGADIDGDFDLDFMVTDNHVELGSRLYVQTSPGKFEYRTMQAGMEATRFHVSWGVGLHDFDHDGDVDCLLANGMFYSSPGSQGGPQENLLYLNDGGGHFTRFEPPSGSGLSLLHTSQGALFADLDHDGDLDALIMNEEGPPQVLRNDMASGNWLQLYLVDPARMPAVGAIVTFLDGGEPFARRWIHGTPSYGGSSSKWLHVGLAGRERVDVEIQWPGGEKQTGTLDANQFKTVRRGQPL